MDYREKSWWLESLPEEIVPNPPLQTAQKAAVVIIGGGYTGLSTAYHLKRLNADLDVRLLEGQVCGFGASGRNGGFSMTLFGLSKGLTKLRFGDEKAAAAHRYMEEAVDYLHQLITENSLDCDYEQSGYLLVATSDAQIKRLEAEFRIAERWGLDIEQWSRERLAEEFHTSAYKLGWFEARCGILNPAKLARRMKELADKSGAVIYENSPVTGFQKGPGGQYTVTTTAGRIDCEYLVFATNAYSVVFPRLRSLQAPVFTHMVLTEPLSEEQLASIGWKCRAGVEDSRDLIHYYRLTRDNRIAMGGGDVSIGFGQNLNRDLNQRISRELQAHITELFPQLEGVRISHRWGGPVSVTVDMAPAIGYIGDDNRVLYSLGAIGHGVSMTTLNGRTMAEMICGVSSHRTEMFFVGRRTIPWPPEPVRFVVGHAIRGYMRLEDRLRYK